MVLDQNYHKMIDENKIRIKAIPKLMDHTLSKLAKSACNELNKSETSLIKTETRNLTAAYPPASVELT